MKSTLKLLMTLFFINIALITNAQISINSDGTSPDASAMLDVTSTTKGMLIPRMTTAERTAITSPATGLMIYDTDESAFWYYNGTAWTAIGGSSAFTSENDVTYSNNNSDDFVFGTDSLNHGSGGESKVIFDKSKGAFRAGTVTGTHWDESNIGNYSISLGFNTSAIGNNSTSFGYSTTADGNYSTSFGLSSSASGYNSTSFGYNAIASGENAISFGYNTTASGKYAIGLGRNTTSYSYGETVLGVYNTVYTPNSTTSFNNNDRLFVIGNGTGTSALSDAMIVYKNGNTEINGDLTVSGSIIIGNTAFTSENGITYSNNNNDDFLFGADSSSYVSGTEYKLFFDKSKGAFRAGTVTGTHWNEDNRGYYSASFGHNATASGDYAISSGKSTTSSGSYSTSFGRSTIASGNNSTSLGRSTTASGDYATSLGRSTVAYSYGETVLGLYNTAYSPDNTADFDNDDRLFVIGNGTTSSALSDAMIVYKNGNTAINGALTLNEAFTFPTADGTSSQVLITNGSGTLSWTDYGDDLGTHIATQNIDLDDHDIYFRGGDTNHGVGWRGSTNTFASESPNGPVLYGYRGGGLGTTRNGELLALQWDDNGDVTINGDLTADSYTTASDERLKTNIQPTTYGLTDILNIDVRDYQFKKDKTKHLHTGFLAQQLYEIYPHAVNKGGDDENINPWSVDYSRLTPVLVKGMQEQQIMIEKLKAENEELNLFVRQARIKNEGDNKRFQRLEQQVSTIETLKQENAAMKAMLQQIQAQLGNQ